MRGHGAFDVSLCKCGAGRPQRLTFLAASLLFMVPGLPVAQDCDRNSRNPCAAVNNEPGCSERVALFEKGDKVSS
jgi:hypothetical protein